MTTIHVAIFVIWLFSLTD